MRGVRLDLVAGATVMCFAGGCSLLVNTDGLSGGSAMEGGPPAGEGGDVPDAGEAAAGDADASGPSNEAAADSASVDSGVPDAPHTDSGPRDAASDAPACRTDLSNIGTADFTITLTLTTSQTGYVAVVNQRNVCNLAPLWDVRLSNGNLYIETCDGPNYSRLTTSGALANDGKPHAIDAHGLHRRNVGRHDRQHEQLRGASAFGVRSRPVRRPHGQRRSRRDRGGTLPHEPLIGRFLDLLLSTGAKLFGHIPERGWPEPC
jgi:hypothetical protein